MDASRGSVPVTFHISRTSVWDDDVAPCEGARRGEYLYVDERTCSLAEARSRGLFRDERGENYRDLPNGHCARDLTLSGWLYDISSLDELREFICAHGSVVLEQDIEPATPTLEIYDGYRE